MIHNILFANQHSLSQYGAGGEKKQQGSKQAAGLYKA